MSLGVYISIFACVAVASAVGIAQYRRKPGDQSFKYTPINDRDRQKKAVIVVWSGGMGKSEARSADSLEDSVKFHMGNGEETVILIHTYAPGYSLAVIGSESGKICLCYFTGKRSSHPGFASVNPGSEGQNDGESFKFRLRSGEGMRIGTENFIDESSALQGVRDFFEEPDLPGSVDWVEARRLP